MIGCLDPSVRLVGRWFRIGEKAVATAPGSYFEIAFLGYEVELHFNTARMTTPPSHLWIAVDNGPRVEVPIDAHIRIQTRTPGNHVLEVILKSSVENAHRWYQPLEGRVEFLGYDADMPGELPADERKTIEFVGDSITEGVLIDDATGDGIEWLKRPYQDNSTATYAWITAENLNLKPIIMGYGSVGVTQEGCACVPKAQNAYPFCFHEAPIDYANPDYIIINHGTNDRGKDSSIFRDGYWHLIDVIANYNPKSKIILVPPFCGAWHDEILSIASEYTGKTGRQIDFISAAGWITSERIHPDRNGHRAIAEQLTNELKKLGL